MAAGRFTTAEDRVVADRAADGDPAAFEELVRRFGPFMRAYTTRFMGYSADTDDIVQETFVVAWQRLGELTDGAKVRSWLMRILTRKAVDRARTNRPSAPIDSLEPVAADHVQPDVRVSRSTEMRALSEALKELPADQRQAWVLREVAEYSYEEIAEELDVPLSTVRGLLSRARKFIIVRMEAWR